MLFRHDPAPLAHVLDDFEGDSTERLTGFTAPAVADPDPDEQTTVGKVDLTATYDVNVKGVIGTGDNITCTVSYNKVMNGALRGADGGLLGGVGPYDSVDGGKLNAELTQGKTVWSGEEVSKLADDGNTVVGTSGTDSLHFTGSVRSATQFADSLNYSFSTGYANIGAALNKVHGTSSDTH